MSMSKPPPPPEEEEEEEEDGIISCRHYGDDPLPLDKLKRWVSQHTYQWIQADDEAQLALKKEKEEETAADIFGNDDDDSQEEGVSRIQEWTSSSIYPDGIGGYQPRAETDPPVHVILNDDEDENNKTYPDVTIIFMLSESYEGFGDTLWASARHVANVLASPKKCREWLTPVLLKTQQQQQQQSVDDNSVVNHPLLGKTLVELGAGAGVPSCAAMHCGARVVCTDLASPNRIRCMAECIERNYQKTVEKNHGCNNNDAILQYAQQARACPCQWGKPVDEVLEALHPRKEELFDILVAADCCYMPWCHDELLDTIHKLVNWKSGGIAIICFCLHGNTDDDEVMKIDERAKHKGYVVEKLPSTQLTPPGSGMEATQGLVHTLRLTRSLE